MHPLTRESLQRRSSRRAVRADRDRVVRRHRPAVGGPGDARDRAGDAPGGGWIWRGRADGVEGPAWGGNLEIIDWQLRAGRYVRPAEDYAGSVLLLETSEEMPGATTSTGCCWAWASAGCWRSSRRVLVGRRQGLVASSGRSSPAGKEQYAADQRDAVIARALDEYNPGSPMVFDVDFGHTDPQLVIPHGGRVVVDGAARRITVDY